ncbi:MAG TPA: sugar ABC transporter substrate-binding protein [Anaerolineales bacterium]|nr:sugar ABC transporter substrate-binding protein [Anaerolineales bacterium]
MPIEDLDSLPRESDATPASHPRGRISRRDFLRVAGAAGAGAALAACSPASKATVASGGKIQLVYQDWRTDWFPGLAQAMLEEFHESHPNIQVFFTMDPEDLGDVMIADFQAGTAPDVFAGCCDFFPSWAQQGYLLDLRPFVQADLDQETLGDWSPAQVESLRTADGQQFGLPKYHGALALYYNKDLFDAHAVEYPDGTWTHDDYLEAMKRLGRSLAGQGVADVYPGMVDIAWERIQMHVNGWGGHLVDPEDPHRSWIARPEALAAMEWIRARMWDDRVMASFLDVGDLETRRAFIQGRVATVEDGSWSLKDILAGAPFRIGVAPFPAGPARRVTLATTDGFGIYAGTRHPEAAWELVKFLISQEYGRAMAKAHFLQPARRSLIPEWIGFIRDEFPEATQGLDLEAFADGHVRGYSVTAEIFANMAAARSIVEPAWQRIFTLGQAPVSEMVKVSAAIEMAQSAAP